MESGPGYHLLQLSQGAGHTACRGQGQQQSVLGPCVESGPGYHLLQLSQGAGHTACRGRREWMSVVSPCSGAGLTTTNRCRATRTVGSCLRGIGTALLNVQPCSPPWSIHLLPSASNIRSYCTARGRRGLPPQDSNSKVDVLLCNVCRGQMQSSSCSRPRVATKPS